MSGKGKAYNFETDGDCIVITYEDGEVCKRTILGSKIKGKDARISSLSGAVILNYNCYVGSLSLDDWQDALSGCDSSTTDEPIEPTEPVKTPLESKIYYLNSEEPDKFGNRTAVCIRPWLDGNKICYVLDGEVPSEDGSNLLTIENYTIMNNAGTVIPENLSGLTTPACVTLLIPAGGSITLADVLAEAVADGVLLPDGTAPTGLLNYNITVFQIGQIAKDAAGTKMKVGSQAVTLADDEVINAGSTYCLPPRKLKDGDGDCFVEGENLTTVIENCSTKEPAAIRFCADFIPLDADDADDTVQ